MRLPEIQSSSLVSGDVPEYARHVFVHGLGLAGGGSQCQGPFWGTVCLFFIYGKEK